MTDPNGTPATGAPAVTADAAAPPQADDGTPGGGGLTWLDGLGIAAGVVLVVIVADILSDGRLISRRLLRRRAPEAAEGEAAADDGTG